MGGRRRKTNLEPAVVFCDFVCKVNFFSLGQKLPKLRPVVHTQVVTYKVSVDAVPPPLLPVQQQVRSFKNQERAGEQVETETETDR